MSSVQQTFPVGDYKLEINRPSYVYDANTQRKKTVEKNYMYVYILETPSIRENN